MESKQLVVNYVAAGNAIPAAAREFDVSETSVAKWCKKLNPQPNKVNAKNSYHFQSTQLFRSIISFKLILCN